MSIFKIQGDLAPFPSLPTPMEGDVNLCVAHVGVHETHGVCPGPKRSEKCPKSNKLLKTKRILIPNYKLSGSPVFTFVLPGECSHPWHPSITSLCRTCFYATTSTPYVNDHHSDEDCLISGILSLPK